MEDNLIPKSYCVIGGGIVGSWTALQLIRDGVPTTLIEQFPFDHTRGSSHGGSRAFRLLEDGDLSMLIDSLSEWKNLEKSISDSLFVETGLINFGENDDPYLLKSMNMVEQCGYHVKWLGSEEISKRYPMIQYPKNWGAAYDETAGLLIASKCVSAVRNEFSKLGGKIIHAVTKSVKSSNKGHAKVKIRHPLDLEENLLFKKAVVCAGPWTSKLFPQLKSILTTKLIPVTYWRELNDQGKPIENPERQVYSATNGFPIIFNARLANVYAIPSYEYPGLVKVLYHGGPNVDPDSRDTGDLQSYIQYVSDYVKTHFPNLDYSEPSISERCMYTCTSDNLPILDKIEENIVLGAGFSGSGFKHSPSTGKILASLALGKENELPQGYQRSRFKLDRFTSLRD